MDKNANKSSALEEIANVRTFRAKNPRYDAAELRLSFGAIVDMGTKNIPLKEFLDITIAMKQILNFPKFPSPCVCNIIKVVKKFAPLAII